MNMTLSPSTRRVLADFKEQLLRWNPQINLVSRKATGKIIDALIEQGIVGIEATAEYLLAADDSGGEQRAQVVKYFDLGSGGGIPGIIWHWRLAELGLAPSSCLVEPRSKRAWFLERLGNISDMPPFTVLCERWGEEPGEEGPPCPGLESSGTFTGEQAATILVSLKALKLTDKQILAGLARMAAQSGVVGDRLLIARYHPPDQALSSELVELLGLPAEGEQQVVAGLDCVANRCWVTPLPGEVGPCASLVYSEYLIRPV
jgi:rRNA small subunit methyltransferase G